MCCERWSNEAATVHADIWPDQPDVPAVTIFTFRKELMSSADVHVRRQPVASTPACALGHIYF